MSTTDFNPKLANFVRFSGNRRGFDRHDLEWSKRFLPTLRARGYTRRLDFEGGRYDSGHPNRFYGVRSTAFMELHGYLGYREDSMGVLLDAGCGESADADIALLTGYSKAYAVDLFAPLHSSTKFQAEFMLGDICERLPIRAHSVDAIISNWVIPLMSHADRLRFYKQAHRLLKCTGVLSIAADSLSSGYCYEDEVFRIKNETDRLQKAGFEIARRDPNVLIVVPRKDKNG